MATINQLSTSALLAIQESVANRISGCEYLEEAAQNYMSVLFEELHEAILLARFFAAVPMNKLPDENRLFVQQLAKSKGVDDLLRENTMVLSLLGSRGVEEGWNDRKESSGHVGIPLVSADFIEAIPMMSRLLKQMGLGLDWIDSNDTELVVRAAGKMGGVFHVEQAATERDNQGRKIIAAQDFVKQYGVKTVFGIGGGYLGTDIFFTTIIFSNEVVNRDIIRRFMLQANIFKTSTMALTIDGRIFSSHH
jgi:hypothetical protein